MGKHSKRKRTGLKHSSKHLLAMEEIKDIKILHYIIPMRNASGVCLIAETGYNNSLFSTKRCFFVEETPGKNGFPSRTYSLDNKEYSESMMRKFLNFNVYIEFKDFDEKTKKDIQQYVQNYVNMSRYKLGDNAKVNLLNEQECYDLISKI